MSVGNINNCIKQLASEDRDFRYMAALELTKIIESTKDWSTIENSEVSIFSALKKSLSDPLAEVLNLAINCLGALTVRSNINTVIYILTQLVQDVFSSDDLDAKLAYSAAIKKIVTESSKAQDKQAAIENMILPVLTTKIKLDTESYALQEALAIIEVILKSSSKKTVLPKDITGPLSDFLMAVLGSPQALLWRQATSVISELARNLVDTDKLKYTNALCRSIKETNDAELQKRLMKALNAVIQAFREDSDTDFSDILNLNLSLVDGEDIPLSVLALQNAQAILQKASFIDQNILDLLLKVSKDFVSFDPSFIDHGEDFNDDSFDFGDDDDYLFEQEYSDNEDDSWKIRMASVRLLASFISHVLLFNGTNTEKNSVALSAIDVLITRFTEKEDMVRGAILFEFIPISDLLSLAYAKNEPSVVDNISKSALQRLIVSCSANSLKKSKETIKAEFKAFEQLVSLSIKKSPALIDDFLKEVLDAIYQDKSILELDFLATNLKWSYSPGFEPDALAIILAIFSNNNYLGSNLPYSPAHNWKAIVKTILDALRYCFKSPVTKSLPVTFKVASSVVQVLTKSHSIFFDDANTDELKFQLDGLVDIIRNLVNQETNIDICKKAVTLYESLLLCPANKTQRGQVLEFLPAVLEKVKKFRDLSSVGLQSICTILECSVKENILPNFSDDGSIVKQLDSIISMEEKQSHGLVLKSLALCIELSSKQESTNIAEILNIEKTINTVLLVLKSAKIDDSLTHAIDLLQRLLPYVSGNQILEIVKNVLFIPIFPQETSTGAPLADIESLQPVYLRFFASVSEYTSNQLLLQILEYLMSTATLKCKNVSDNKPLVLVSACISVIAVKSEEILKHISAKVNSVTSNFSRDIYELPVCCYIGGNLSFGRAKFGRFTDLLINIIQNPNDSFLTTILNHEYPSLSVKTAVLDSIAYSLGILILHKSELTNQMFDQLSKSGQQLAGTTSIELVFIKSLLSATNTLMSLENSFLYSLFKDLALSSKKYFSSQLILHWIFQRHCAMNVEDDSDVDTSLQLAKIISNIILLSHQTSSEYILELLSSNSNNMINLALTSCMRLCLSALVEHGYISPTRCFFNSTKTDSKDSLKYLLVRCLHNASNENPVLVAEALQLTKSYMKILSEAYPISVDSIKSHFIEKNNENKLEALIRTIFGLTVFRDELVKIEKIGPFQNVIDRGLVSRRLAFEVLESLLSRYPVETISVGLTSDTNMESKVTSITSAIINGLGDRDYSIVVLACSLLIQVCNLLNPEICCGSVQRLLDSYIKESNVNFNNDKINEISVTIIGMLEKIAEKILKLVTVKPKPSDSKQFITSLENAKQSAAELAGVLHHFATLNNDLASSKLNIQLNLNQIFNPLILVFENSEDPDIYKKYKISSNTS